MYAALFKYMLNPFFETVIKRRKMPQYRRFLEKSQWWPRERLVEFQWQELQKLLRHCYAQVPYWQEKFKSLGLTPDDIRSYDDFCKLPLTTKQVIRQNKPRMIAGNYAGKTWSKFTGGSTGAPLELDYTPESFDWRVAAWKRGYSWAGCEDGMRQFWLWGAMLGKKSGWRQWKENLHYFLMNKKYFICHELDDKVKADCLDELNRYNPQVVVAYANPLFAVAKYIQKHRGLKARPRAVISAAEKLYAAQRQVVEEVFGCKVFNTYGCREVMLIGAECPQHAGLHLSVENLYVEILKSDGTPAKPTEQGELVVTDLHNYGMPLVRYTLGDLAVFSAQDSCPCGRGLPMLADVVGRTLDMIRTPEGKEIPGEYFVIVFLDKLGVDRYRIVQERLDLLVVEMIKNVNFNKAMAAAIEKQIESVTGPMMKVEYRFVEDLPLNETGKFRVTVSKI